MKMKQIKIKNCGKCPNYTIFQLYSGLNTYTCKKLAENNQQSDVLNADSVLKNCPYFEKYILVEKCSTCPYIHKWTDYDGNLKLSCRKFAEDKHEYVEIKDDSVILDNCLLEDVNDK